MLDTNICSYIMKRRPVHVLEKFDEVAGDGHPIVISSITYAEMRFGAIGKKANPIHNVWIDEIVNRIDNILSFDKEAVDESTIIRKYLSDKGVLIGYNDSLIAGHAVSVDAILVTNNEKEFSRVPALRTVNWVY